MILSCKFDILSLSQSADTNVSNTCAISIFFVTLPPYAPPYSSIQAPLLHLSQPLLKISISISKPSRLPPYQNRRKYILQTSLSHLHHPAGHFSFNTFRSSSPFGTLSTQHSTVFPFTLERCHPSKLTVNLSSSVLSARSIGRETGVQSQGSGPGK